MSNYIISNDSIKKALLSKEKESEMILNDKSKYNRFIESTKKWLQSHKNIPLIGGLFATVELMLSLVEDYAEKNYSQIPKASIISAIAAIVYVISPIDLIPDVIVGAGFLDDAAVVLLVLEFGLKKDLENYKKWCKERSDERLKEKALRIVPRINKLIENGEIVGVLVLEDYSVRILVNSFKSLKKPYECFAYLYKFDNDDLTDNNSTNDEVLNFIKLVFSHESLNWNKECINRIMFDYKCLDFEEYYIILDKDEKYEYLC